MLLTTSGITMYKNACTYFFAISVIAMLTSFYLIASNIQDSMNDEVLKVNERTVRLKQAVHVYDYLLKVNHETDGLSDKKKTLDEISDLLMDENYVINRNEHRKLREEIANAINLQQVPNNQMLNSWLASSILNDMIELEKDIQPSQVNVAPFLLITDKKWSTTFTFLWLSMIVAAFCGGSILSDFLSGRKQKSLSK